MNSPYALPTDDHASRTGIDPWKRASLSDAHSAVVRRAPTPSVQSRIPMGTTAVPAPTPAAAVEPASAVHSICSFSKTSPLSSTRLIGGIFPEGGQPSPAGVGSDRACSSPTGCHQEAAPEAHLIIPRTAEGSNIRRAPPSSCKRAGGGFTPSIPSPGCIVSNGGSFAPHVHVEFLPP